MKAIPKLTTFLLAMVNSRLRATLKSLSHLDMGGLIELKKPDVELGIFEEFRTPETEWSAIARGIPVESRLIFFGILVSLVVLRQGRDFLPWL